MPTIRVLLTWLAALFLGLAAAPAAGQCPSGWIPGEGFPGVNNDVHSLALMPNGDVVAGGRFNVAGGIRANCIARWNGIDWAPLGSGMSGGSFPTVYALAALSNGEIIAGGNFTTAGGVACSSIARWNGTTWAPLGSGLANGTSPAYCFALALMPNGDLIAAGRFCMAGGVAANNIARWNGSEWSPLGTGMSDGQSASVYALAVTPDGELIAAGHFGYAGVVEANNIARWNGSVWAPFGSGVGGGSYQNPRVSALVVMPNGNLIAGGYFTTAGGAACSNIARWNGVMWTPLGSGTHTSVEALAVMPNGGLVVGGGFSTAVGALAVGISTWNGAAWASLGSNVGGSVYSLLVMPNGSFIAGGGFFRGDGVGAHNIARWDGAAWLPLGGHGFGGFGSTGAIRAFATLPNGDLIAAGGFGTAGGVPANEVARWDGSNWSPLGTGLSIDVFAVVVMPNGDLVAAGNFFLYAGGV
ncbi:MAG: hypothetical protein WC718_15115, partial [Phycisphaerales bacterium]